MAPVVRLLLVLPLLIVATRADASGACIVTGTAVTLGDVTVKPAGEDAFQLGLTQVPIRAHLPARCGDPLTLDVDAPLTFTAKRDQVWLSLTRDVQSSDGLIVARRGARVIDACEVGDRILVSAITHAADVMEGEHKPGDEEITGLDVPCDALTLDSIERVDEAEQAPGTDHNWEVRGDAATLVLRGQTGSGGMRHVCSGCSYVRELKSKSGWLFVEATGEGVSARGWVKRSLLKRVPDTTGVGHTYGCYGDHGGGSWGEGGPNNFVYRTGTLRKGTAVFASRGTGQWAVVAIDTHVNVRFEPNSPWAELRAVPGLDGDPSGSPWLNATVRLDALTLDPLPAKP